MKVDILGKDGSKKGSIDLNPSVFGIEPNVAVMHQAVKMHLANRRQGTHKAKERSGVRGGGKKPWRQKGRGVARAGTSRSPLWVGGGTIFGPRPHSYRQAMPKKMRRLARRSALSLKAQSSEVYIVENLSFDQPKTGMFASMLKAINISGKKTLLLTATENETVLRSGRNIPNCFILEARNASTYDLLNNQVLLIEEGAIEVLHGQLVEEGREMEAVDFDGGDVEEELILEESGDGAEFDEAGDDEGDFDDDETGTDDEEEKE